MSECKKCPKLDVGYYEPIPHPKPSGDCDCDFSNYYTKEQVDSLIQAIESGEFIVVEELPQTGDPKNIYLVPKQSGTGYDEYIYVDGEWELIGDTSVDIDLSDYYTKSEVDDLIPDVSNFTTKTYVDSELDKKQDTLVDGENISIVDNTISAVDTKYTAGENVTITNNVISATQPDVTGFATKTELNNGLASKQDTLTAGNNVTISNGVISATDTTYQAGNNITISNNTINADLSDYYDKQDVDDIVDGIVTGQFMVVQTLPPTGLDKTIYLVPKQGGQTQNIYDEYLYINNAWEKIGDTEIDLSQYATKQELATKQDVLTAGNNIVISNGTISASFTKQELLTIMGYGEIVISKTDENNNEVAIQVIGKVV